MLQALMRVGHVAVLWHISFKKLFSLLDLPDTQPGVFVDLMLKKNRHETNLRFKIADLIANPETFHIQIT